MRRERSAFLLRMLDYLKIITFDVETDIEETLTMFKTSCRKQGLPTLVRNRM